ncbi:hypothetical protein BDQ94DRAFT_164110 [Aspergillus welwitschiae]|uniref:Uncharacterized protein n=1 Tax=Aspergillus welwitschiae TaxID=1341132 RepID=A0A3F3PIX8_9EURO|nr:hypothetical protein BDQ94DRAFT_164110 [Aspergillus welwitschiae]RDH26885.1 hypothetical protein BDQ94DRAFT_164110 [Aspergillus welwitschiae]
MPILSNWNNDIKFKISDIQTIVKQAFNKNEHVAVIGAMHSTTQCMISAISGTHTNNISMRRSAQFFLYILSVKLVTPTGEIIEFLKSQNKDYLPAIHSYYGMLGVVCEVTIRVFKTQPDFAAELQTLKDRYDQQCRKFLEPEILRPLFLGVFLNLIESKNIMIKLHSSAEIVIFINFILVDLPLKIIRHNSYIINLCDRAILWAQDDPDFDLLHGGIPHINKTRDGAIGNFANTGDSECIRRFLQICRQLDSKDLFLNNYFKIIFRRYL